MNRRSFLRKSGLGLAGLALTPRTMNQLFDSFKSTDRMPVLFIGHGTPMNAITDNPYAQKWKELGRSLPETQAILMISAHWMSFGTTKIMAQEKPKMIYDFGGFPKELSEVNYNAPGSPSFAHLTHEIITSEKTKLDEEWGFDHGTWVPLMHLFPEANIPVFQLSIDMRKPPAWHYTLAQELQALRQKGVLIIGSGNVVHNLRNMSYNPADQFDWALEFDHQVKKLIESKEHAQLNQYDALGQAARLSIPTEDHYLPLMYTLGQQNNEDELLFFNEQVEHGSISMRSFLIQ